MVELLFLERLDFYDKINLFKFFYFHFADIVSLLKALCIFTAIHENKYQFREVMKFSTFNAFERRDPCFPKRSIDLRVLKRSLGSSLEFCCVFQPVS
jgi:hypothetical protein